MAPAFCVGSWRSSPFDCFVTTKQQKPLFNPAPGKTDGPTVNFRPALVSFSACLLSKTRARIHGRRMANFDCPWHWKRSAQQRVFPRCLGDLFCVSAFLSSRFLVFFHPVFPGRWIYFLLLFVRVHCTV